MSKNGSDILLSMRTSTGPDVYVDVGGQRGVSMDANTEEIDVSNKNDGADFKLLPGRRKATISLEHLFVASETAFAALQTAQRAGTSIRVRRVDAGSDDEQADGFITSISESFPDQDAGMVSVGITVDGQWGAIV